MALCCLLCRKQPSRRWRREGSDVPWQLWHSQSAESEPLQMECVQQHWAATAGTTATGRGPFCSWHCVSIAAWWDALDTNVIELGMAVTRNFKWFKKKKSLAGVVEGYFMWFKKTKNLGGGVENFFMWLKKNQKKIGRWGGGGHGGTAVSMKCPKE